MQPLDQPSRDYQVVYFIFTGKSGGNILFTDISRFSRLTRRDTAVILRLRIT